jgi:hypothetical protein
MLDLINEIKNFTHIQLLIKILICELQCNYVVIGNDVIADNGAEQHRGRSLKLGVIPSFDARISLCCSVLESGSVWELNSTTCRKQPLCSSTKNQDGYASRFKNVYIIY